MSPQLGSYIIGASEVSPTLGSYIIGASEVSPPLRSYIIGVSLRDNLDDLGLI